MIVKDLRDLIQYAPDAAVVVVRGADHSLREVNCSLTTGLHKGRREWAEDFGEEATPESEYGRRLPILLVGD